MICLYKLMKNMLGSKILPSYLLAKYMQIHSGVYI